LMEPTLDEALDRIFGVISGEEPEEQEDGQYDNTNINDLVEQANKIFIEANEASKNGDWAAYGESLKELEDILNQLNTMINGSQDANNGEANTENVINTETMENTETTEATEANQ